MRKRIRLDNPTKLDARHMCLDGHVVDITFNGEFNEYYSYRIQWAHNTDWNEIMIYKECFNKNSARVIFDNRKRSRLQENKWFIRTLKNRDKLVSKMIELQRNSVL